MLGQVQIIWSSLDIYESCNDCVNNTKQAFLTSGTVTTSATECMLLEFSQVSFHGIPSDVHIVKVSYIMTAYHQAV